MWSIRVSASSPSGSSSVRPSRSETYQRPSMTWMPIGFFSDAGDLGVGDLLLGRRARDLVEDVDLARLRVRDPAAGADVARGGQDHAAVRQEVHAGDLRLEGRRADVGQRVVRVDRVQAQAVAGRVGGALAVLVARGGDAHDAGLGGEDAARDDHEAAGARGAPLELEDLVEAGLDVVDAELVVARGQRDGAVLGRVAVQAVVVDDDVAVDAQDRAVVAREAEGVLTGRRDVQVRQDRGLVVVLTAVGELGRGRPVDGASSACRRSASGRT